MGVLDRNRYNKIWQHITVKHFVQRSFRLACVAVGGGGGAGVGDRRGGGGGGGGGPGGGGVGEPLGEGSVPPLNQKFTFQNVLPTNIFLRTAALSLCHLESLWRNFNISLIDRSLANWLQAFAGELQALTSTNPQPPTPAPPHLLQPLAPPNRLISPCNIFTYKEASYFFMLGRICCLIKAANSSLSTHWRNFSS